MSTTIKEIRACPERNYMIEVVRWCGDSTFSYDRRRVSLYNEFSLDPGLSLDYNGAKELIEALKEIFPELA